MSATSTEYDRQAVLVLARPSISNTLRLKAGQTIPVEVFML